MDEDGGWNSVSSFIPGLPSVGLAVSCSFLHFLIFLCCNLVFVLILPFPIDVVIVIAADNYNWGFLCCYCYCHYNNQYFVDIDIVLIFVVVSFNFWTLVLYVIYSIAYVTLNARSIYFRLLLFYIHIIIKDIRIHLEQFKNEWFPSWSFTRRTLLSPFMKTNFRCTVLGDKH